MVLCTVLDSSSGKDTNKRCQTLLCSNFTPVKIRSTPNGLSMNSDSFDALDPRQFILIKGARMHNLKSVNVAIPRRNLVVITGLSGSGKSTLAFDTLYAEGQRRYVESLSSYARQFLGRLDKPEVDSIRGISPAVAIEQKVVSRSSRSTVGTSTELYDYLKLLFARIGRTYSPISGKEVKRNTVEDVVSAIQQRKAGERFMVLAPLEPRSDRTLAKHLEVLLQQGFVRVATAGKVEQISALLDREPTWEEPVLIVVDRLVVSQEEHDIQRLADSVETAFYEGSGSCTLQFVEGETLSFSNRFELDGMAFEEPSVNFFTFNNPVGACKRCEGFGHVIGIDADLVIPDPTKSIYEDAIVPWRGEKMQSWKEELIYSAAKFDFPIHTPIKDLNPEQRQLLWTGNAHFKGLDAFFAYLEEKAYKIQFRVMMSRYRGRTTCPDCNGTRLRKDAHYVKVHGASLPELVLEPVGKLKDWIAQIPFTQQEMAIGKHLIGEISNRLGYLCDVGLEYLTLNRLSSSLSGGESQRINLATCLGSSLVGSMYILDEPSIGLHPRDTMRLIGVLQSLRDKGNTVIVVEHEEEIMRAADYLIDMGPGAGVYGGEVVFSGTPDRLLQADNLTAEYLTGKQSVPTRDTPRPWKDRIEVIGASENNLKSVNALFPLHAMTAVTGVSGSGKSTLVGDILYPGLQRLLGEHSPRVGKHQKIEGETSSIGEVSFVDQNPIGKSSRSNPVTYIKAYDDIRALMASQPLAKARGYKPSHFSFNVSGGRCDNCEGEGQVTIEMQFMADIQLTCDVCHGKRFKQEILEISYRDKNIADILGLSVDESLSFFGHSAENTEQRIVRKLQPLSDVGLGYIALGQSSNTLSGGEAQRVKLASYLAMGERASHTLFIFDEPTTGLHVDDVRKLLDSFRALLSHGHSLVIIEHHLEVIKNADWVIDLGPEGGEGGGSVVFQGTPEELRNVPTSYTGQFLARENVNA